MTGRRGGVALIALWLLATGGIIKGEQMDAWQAIETADERLEQRLAATLRDRFPELPDKATRATLDRLLAEATAAAGERRAALLLTADFLAARLAPTTDPTPNEIARQAPAPTSSARRRSPARRSPGSGRRWAPPGCTTTSSSGRSGASTRRRAGARRRSRGCSGAGGARTSSAATAPTSSVP